MAYRRRNVSQTTNRSTFIIVLDHKEAVLVFRKHFFPVEGLVTRWCFKTFCIRSTYLKHGNFLVSEESMKTLIFDWWHPVKCQLSDSLGQQQRRHFNAFESWMFAEVVDQSGRVQLVQDGVPAKAGGIVVVTMDTGERTNNKIGCKLLRVKLT